MPRGAHEAPREGWYWDHVQKGPRRIVSFWVALNLFTADSLVRVQPIPPAIVNNQPSAGSPPVPTRQSAPRILTLDRNMNMISDKTYLARQSSTSQRSLNKARIPLTHRQALRYTDLLL